jgi:hypothetical protein
MKTHYYCLYSSFLDLGRFCMFIILYTVGSTPWTADQLVERSYLLTGQHEQNKCTQTWIRTHDIIVCAGGTSSSVR